MNENQNDCDISVFNNSSLTARTPPTDTAMRNITKKPVACCSCSVTDVHSKVICNNCGAFYHVGCLPECDHEAIKKEEWCCNECVELLACSKKGTRESERLKRKMHGSTSSLTKKDKLPEITPCEANTVESITRTSNQKNDTSLGFLNLNPEMQSTRAPTQTSRGPSISSSRNTIERLKALEEEHLLRQKRKQVEAAVEASRREAKAAEEASRRQAEILKLEEEAARLKDEEEFQRQRREISEHGSRRANSVHSSAKNREIDEWLKLEAAKNERKKEEDRLRAEREERERHERDRRRAEDEEREREVAIRKASEEREEREREVAIRKASEEREARQREANMLVRDTLARERQELLRQKLEASSILERAAERETEIARREEEIRLAEVVNNNRTAELDQLRRYQERKANEERRERERRRQEEAEHQRAAERRRQEDEEARRRRNDSGAPNPETPNAARNQLPWLDHTLTPAQFLESTLGASSYAAQTLNLTQSQIQARHIVSRDLVSFAGDPKLWPQFISAFVSSTHQCGFTAEENVARLSKSLKGDAYEAVRTRLTPSSLPTALITLRSMYGRPKLLLEAAMEELRRIPQVRLERIETIVTMSVKVRSFCDTVREAGMAAYLNNPTLLTELAQKLPPTMFMEWGLHQHSAEQTNPVVSIEVFQDWLHTYEESAHGLATKPLSLVRDSISTRQKTKNDAFHAAHEFANGRSDDTRRSANTSESKCPFCDKGGHSARKCREFERMQPAERWNTVKKLKACVGCFGDHWLCDCPTKRQCSVDGCNREHHPLLHVRPRGRRSTRRPTSRREQRDATNKTQAAASSSQSVIDTQPSTSRAHQILNAHRQQSPSRAFYQVVPVTLYGTAGKQIDTFAFLDNGSTVTLLEQSVADKLGLVGVEEQLTLKWTNGITRKEDGSRRVHCQISGRGGAERYNLQSVRTARELALPRQAISRDNLQRYPHLQNVGIATHGRVQPTLLIGVDHHQLLTPQQTIEGQWMDPVAVLTRLGWTLLGGGQLKESSDARIHYHHEEDQRLHDLVKGFFALESLGIKIPAQEVETPEATRSRNLLKETVRRLPEGRYQAGLLWRTDNTKLPASRNMAMHRLLSFERKLQRDPVLSQAVKNQFASYIQDEFLVKLSPNEAKKNTDRTWYLPIFAVKNPNKPSKTRLVWDAAATVDGVSLNTELLTGPDLLTNLVGVLLRFREHHYAVSADIKQMFHQVRIREADQDAQRCLWRNPDTQEVETYRMAVMTFGAACSPSTAQYVKNLHATLYQHLYPRAVEAIHHRHYVDDYIDSFSTAQECVEVARQVTTIHGTGGFILRNFTSNSAAVLEELANDPEQGEKSLGNQDPSTTVLGMRWLTREDKLCFRVNEQRIGNDVIRAERHPTKRQVLRLLMMVFDPLGLLGFYILQGKLIMKDVWRTGVEWDQEILQLQMAKWQEWVRSLKSIEKVEIPRCYLGGMNATRLELHTFVDASEHAAAAVVYLLGISENSRRVAFVMSKTKIAPNKAISIPRMELQAAVIGARLANTVRDQQAIHISQMHFWSDSRNVLCWIRSPRTFKPFVAHRIGEILELTDSQDWHWVPTAENVADEATKWKMSATYCIPPTWFEGPRFLKGPTAEYPQERSQSTDLSDEELEVRCLHINIEAGHNLTPDFARFSKLQRLIRTQAYVLRFFNRSKGNKHITPEELERAKLYIIRSVQLDSYAADWHTVKLGEPVPKTSKLRTLSPFMDPHSIIRMRSRLRDAEYLDFDQRCPIILPQRHPFTTLLIRQVHERHYHQFQGTVLNELHQKYRIPKLRSQLLQVRRECMLCRRRDVTPEVPEMAALPRSRMAVNLRPFTYVGVDYFGPITVKIGRRNEKRWGVIFTCLTVRAVHLELAASLSADTFLMMFRAFVARRGMPREVYCDNGTNFRGAETELRQALQDNIARGVREQFAEVTWKFNPPAAPHMGGAWERLIRSVKNGLKHALPDRNPTDELLRCCLVEIESVVNSRPLTYVELENDSLEALTPNHFLLGTSSGVKPYKNFTDDVHVLRLEWKRQQAVIQHFWTRWTNEYLPTISQRTRWYDPVTPLQVGDVVAIVDEKTPYSWILGRIVGIVTSKDGSVRQAEVKTTTGVLRRPASKLAVLLRITDELNGQAGSSTGGSVAKSSSPSLNQ